MISKVIEHDEKDEELNEGKMPEGLKNYLMKKVRKKDEKRYEGNVWWWLN